MYRSAAIFWHQGGILWRPTAQLVSTVTRGMYCEKKTVYSPDFLKKMLAKNVAVG